MATANGHSLSISCSIILIILSIKSDPSHLSLVFREARALFHFDIRSAGDQALSLRHTSLILYCWAIFQVLSLHFLTLTFMTLRANLSVTLLAQRGWNFMVSLEHQCEQGDPEISVLLDQLSWLLLLSVASLDKLPNLSCFIPVKSFFFCLALYVVFDGWLKKKLETEDWTKGAECKNTGRKSLIRMISDSSSTQSQTQVTLHLLRVDDAIHFLETAPIQKRMCKRNIVGTDNRQSLMENCEDGLGADESEGKPSSARLVLAIAISYSVVVGVRERLTRSLLVGRDWNSVPAKQKHSLWAVFPWTFLVDHFTFVGVDEDI